jgi:lysophospholipase L1-like esterase
VRRRLLSAAASLLGGLVLVAAVECALRAAGWEARVPGARDPYLNLTPFFRQAVRDDGTPVLRHLQGPVEFLAEKPVNGFRVFVLGESSVAGFPYTPEHAFPAFLQRRLAAALPTHRVEVVNCGVTGIASWHVRRIASEIARYQPDVVLVYSGHNDWVLREPSGASAVLSALARLRFYQLAVQAGAWVRRARHGPLDEEAASDPEQPLAIMDRLRGRDFLSDADRVRITRRFDENLAQTLASARAAGALPIAASLAQNLRDWEPGASRHRDALSAADRIRWERRLGQGDRLRAAGDCRRGLGAYAAAGRIDERPAILHFARGRCLDRLGLWERARDEYRQASDLDELPLGAPSALNSVIRDRAKAAGARFVDVAGALEAESPHGLVGDQLFYDYLHPNLRGNERIAAILAAALRDLGVPAPATAWQGDGYRDPDPEALRAADPELRAREHLMRFGLLLMLDRAEEAARDRDEVLRLVPGWRPFVERIARDWHGPRRRTVF